MALLQTSFATDHCSAEPFPKLHFVHSSFYFFLCPSQARHLSLSAQQDTLPSSLPPSLIFSQKPFKEEN